MTADPAYWAFISYSSHDARWARWLQGAIEARVVPRHLRGRPTPAGPAPRRFRPLFRDRSDLAADADLAGRVTDALDRSAFLIVLCSPGAAASRWVDEEIRHFRALHGPGRILAVIVAGSPSAAADDAYQACFPPALRYRDGEAEPRPEPIAADLRPGGDGRRLVVQKLVAGMLGVGLDELVRREAQRRQRQMAAVAAASLAGMTIMAGLAGAALVARNDAIRQRAQAQGLIGFMLTNLRKRLEDSGRLDLMDGIGPKALAYYAVQNPADLDANALSQRSDALRLMGAISEERGHLDEAEKAYAEASDTTAELLARAPGDGQRVFDHAQSVFYVGDLAAKRGEEARAEAAYRTYLDLARRLAAIDPANDDWRMEHVYAQSALGSLYLDQGREAEAATAFADALGVAAAIVRRHPANTDQAMDLGQCHAWLADALEKQGKLAEARAHRLTEIDIYRAILARDPTFAGAKFHTLVALRKLARLAMLGGDTAAALEGYGEAVSRAEALLAAQPDNMDLTGEAAVAEIDLGEALPAAGRYAEAAAHGRRAGELAAAALRHDPSVQDWRAYRVRSRLLEAALAARDGEPAEALDLDLATLKALAASPPVGVNIEPRWLIDRARLQTGDDLSALGRRAEARLQWAAAADDLAGLLDRYEPRLLVVLEGADIRLGRLAAARAAARHLAALLPAAAPKLPQALHTTGNSG